MAGGKAAIIAKFRGVEQSQTVGYRTDYIAASEA